MTRNLNEKDIFDALVESEDEELFDNVADLPIDSSSEESSCTENEDPEPPTSKRKREEKRKWSSGDFIPTVHEFDCSQSGICHGININENSEEIEFFELFMSRSTVEIISKEINRYADFLKKKNQISKMQKWVDTDTDEIYM